MSKTSAPIAAATRANPVNVADISWQYSRLSELTSEELYAVVRLRESVFIVEQNCPYPDADGRDPNAWHLLGWQSGADERRLIAYARIFEAGVRYTEASIGRVVTAPEVRGKGVGKILMAEALRRIESLAADQTVKIAAQRRIEKFYLDLGFRTISAPYEEDGIIHVDMIRQTKQ
ncbi:MAG: GNAT family N-acetyltransferase [Gemmatimonadaceae bacterium]